MLDAYLSILEVLQPKFEKERVETLIFAISVMCAEMEKAGYRLNDDLWFTNNKGKGWDVNCKAIENKFSLLIESIHNKTHPSVRRQRGDNSYFKE